MGLEETYDDMLRREFGPNGPSGPRAVAEERAGTASTCSPSAGALLPVTAVPVTAPVHDAFRPRRRSAGSAAAAMPSHAEGPRGFARYRNAALVGAGGLACAAVGAFLGGLGGYFTVDPAAAHPVASAGGPEQSLANAVDQAHRLGRSANDALGTAALTSLAGSLTEGASPFRWLAGTGSGLLAAFPLSGSFATLAESGQGPGGAATPAAAGGPGCRTGSALDLECIISGVTTTLGDLGSIAGGTGGTGAPLSGAMDDLTRALATLGATAAGGSGPVPSAGPLPTPVFGSGGEGSALVAPVTKALGSVDTTTAPSPTGTTSTTTTTQPPGSGTTTTVTVPLPSLPLPGTPPVGVGGLSAGVASGGSGSGLSLSLP